MHKLYTGDLRSNDLNVYSVRLKIQLTRFRYKKYIGGAQ